MSESSAAEPLLEVRHLSKNFGAVQALKELSMSVHAGEVVALAGDNGAGKTTLIKAISGVYKPSGGEILLKGEPVSFSTPQEARDQGIETIYQDLALADNLSIGANIFLGREPKTKVWGFLPIIDRKAMAMASDKERLGQILMQVADQNKAIYARRLENVAPILGVISGLSVMVLMVVVNLYSIIPFSELISKMMDEASSLT